MPKIEKQGQTAKTSPKKGGGVLSRIAPMGFNDDEGIKINLYGRSGTGKTTLWSTFPGKILAVITSGGARPGELRSVDTAANRKKIDQVVIKDSSEIREVIEYVRENADVYKTVVLDHATGLQDMVLKEILEIDELPAQKSWGMAKREEYAQCGQQVKEMLRAFLSLKQNVVIIAQERDFKKEDMDDMILPTIASNLMPSITGWLNPAVDYIAQTYIRQRSREVVQKVNGKEIKKRVTVEGKVDFCLRIGPDPVFTIKFRMPKGDSNQDVGVIVDPSYDKIMKIIKGGNE